MKKDKIYLLHIIDASENIEKFIRGVNYKEFIENGEKQSAVIRQLEIIGEATKRISATIKKKYAQLPWKEMAGMRDKLIHDYPEIELPVVWKTANEDIPDIKKQIEDIIKGDLE